MFSSGCLGLGFEVAVGTFFLGWVVYFGSRDESWEKWLFSFLVWKILEVSVW